MASSPIFGLSRCAFCDHNPADREPLEFADLLNPADKAMSRGLSIVIEELMEPADLEQYQVLQQWNAMERSDG